MPPLAVAPSLTMKVPGFRSVVRRIPRADPVVDPNEIDLGAVLFSLAPVNNAG